MQVLKFNEIEELYKTTKSAGSLPALRSQIKKGVNLKDQEYLSINPYRKEELLRMLLGNSIFRVIIETYKDINSMYLEIIPKNNLSSVSPRGNSAYMMSCAEFMKVEGQWCIAKYGHDYESKVLHLNDEEMDEFKAFFGIGPRVNGNGEFNEGLFVKSPFKAIINEWAKTYPSRAKKINKGRYTCGIIDITQESFDARQKLYTDY